MASRAVGLNAGTLMTIIAAGAILPTVDKLVSGHRPDVGNSGFTVPEVSQASGRKASSLASGFPVVFAAAAMLALQEQAGLDSSTEAALTDRKARKHAQDILEALAALQRDLLGRGNPDQTLSRLAALAQMMPSLHDPLLARIVASIRLRAELEILRLTPRLTQQKAPFQES